MSDDRGAVVVMPTHVDPTKVDHDYLDLTPPQSSNIITSPSTLVPKSSGFDNRELNCNEFKYQLPEYGYYAKPNYGYREMFKPELLLPNNVPQSKSNQNQMLCNNVSDVNNNNNTFLSINYNSPTTNASTTSEEPYDDSWSSSKGSSNSIKMINFLRYLPGFEILPNTESLNRQLYFQKPSENHYFIEVPDDEECSPPEVSAQPAVTQHNHHQLYTPRRQRVPEAQRNKQLANYHRTMANETPEMREKRLRRRRENYARKKKQREQSEKDVK